MSQPSSLFLASSASASPLNDLTPEQRERLSALLDQYLSAHEQGAPLDARQLLANHPDLAPALEVYFHSLEDLHALAAGCVNHDSKAHGHPSLQSESARRLGDFELHEEIGRGGMGVVYRARQLSLDREVALKILPFAAVLDPRQVARFKHEAQAAAHLHHPHIVPVFAIGVERGVHYYAMQLVEGQPLDRALAALRERRRRKASGHANTSTLLPANRAEHVRTVIRLGIQAAEALHAAHEFGVVHRDIKPSNLLLDAHGKLWVTDFGLARFQRDASLTRTGDRVGTLRYMSPEQAAGRTTLVDERTDIYSLGITLYELLALRPAFTEQDGPALARQIESHDPPSLRTHEPGIPVELETVIATAIAKDRDERYATAQQFADDLQRVLNGQATLARPATLLDATTRWARRHTRAVYAACAALLVLSVGLATATLLISREKARAESNLARADQYLSDTRQVLGRFGVALAEQLASLPEARAVSRELLQETQQHYDRYRADAQQNPVLLADLALAYGKLALQMEKLGTPDESLTAHQTSTQLFEQLLSREPRNARFQHQLATSQNNLGLAFTRLGRAKDAESQYQQARRRYERLLDESPRDQDALIGLAKVLGNQGLLFQETSRTSEAIVALQKSLDLQLLVYREDAASPEMSLDRDRALTLNSLAALYARESRFDQAAALYGEALAIQRELVAKSPLNESLSRELAITENNLGLLLGRQADWQPAIDAFTRSLEIQDRLSQQAPGDVPLRSNLAMAHSNLALALEKTARLEEAAAHFSEAVEHQRFAAAAAPQIQRYGQLLAAHLAHAARLATPTTP